MKVTHFEFTVELLDGLVYIEQPTDGQDHPDTVALHPHQIPSLISILQQMVDEPGK